MPVNKINIFCYPFGSLSPFATFEFLSFIGCLYVLDAYLLYMHCFLSFHFFFCLMTYHVLTNCCLGTPNFKLKHFELDVCKDHTDVLQIRVLVNVLRFSLTYKLIPTSYECQSMVTLCWNISSLYWVFFNPYCLNTNFCGFRCVVD